MTLKMLKCLSCDRIYEHMHKMKRHVLKHTGERPWVCGVCGRGFTSKENRNKHLMTQHGTQEQPCCGMHN